MNIGSILKYYRIKANKTQQEVSKGICSVSHYSKIEKNSKEVNKDTLDLIFERLGIQLVDIESKNEMICQLLDQLMVEIKYYQKEDAKNTFLQLKEYADLITFTEYLYTYELYKMKYYLFIGDLDKAKIQLNILSKHEINFNQYELNLYQFYSVTYYAFIGEYDLAEEMINKIFKNKKSIITLGGDEYYAIAFVKSKTNLVEGISYLKKALTYYTNEYNQQRVLHCLVSLASNYNKLQVYDEAENLFLHALRMAKEMKLDNFILRIGVGLSLIYIQKNELEKARLQLEVYHDQFNPNIEKHYIYLFSLAYIYYQLDQKDIAKKYFTQVKQSIKANSPYIPYRLLAQMFLLLINNKEKELMEYYEEKIIPILPIIDSFHSDMIKNKVKEVYIRNRHYKKAAQLFLK